MALELTTSMNNDASPAEVVLAESVPDLIGEAGDIVLGQPNDQSMLIRDQGDRVVSRAILTGSGASSPSAADIAVLRALMSSRGKDASCLPNVAALGDRLAAMLVRRFGALTTQEVQVRAQESCQEHWRTHVATLSADAIGVVVRALPVSHDGLLWFDRGLLFSILDDLLGGGGRAVLPARRRERCCTAIEARLIERFSVPLLAEAAQAIAGTAGLELRFGRIETDIRRSEVSPPDELHMMIPFSVELGPLRGRLGLILPLRFFEALHSLQAGGSAATEAGNAGAGWHRRLMSAAWELEVELAAVLGERQIDLSDVASWLPGSSIELGLPLEAPIRLRCGDKDVAVGVAGRRQERLVMTIEHRLELGDRAQ